MERGGGTDVRLLVYDEFDTEPLTDGSVVACLSSGDEPPPPEGFRRGDTDASGVVDISDPIFNLTFQFVGGIDELPCEDAADVDDSGVVDISDPIYNLTPSPRIISAPSNCPCNASAVAAKITAAPSKGCARAA